MAKKNAKKATQPAQKPQPVQSAPPKAQPIPTPSEPHQAAQSNRTVPVQKQKSPMAPSNRARLLWKTFETWAKEQEGSMNADLEQLAVDMDTLWRATPKQHRDSKVDFENRKAEKRREKEAVFYEEMRTEWQKRLDDAGLKDEDWDDITEEEGIAVMKLLGGDAEETVSVNQAVAPTPLSNGSRSTNISIDYDIVSPASFRSDAEDEPAFELFDITSFNDDTNSEASASNPWSWESEASGYNTVNTETPQSSSHSSPKLSPDRVSLGGYVKVPVVRSSQPQSAVAKTSEKKKQTRYIGPDLVDHDDRPQDDEADFASFKMEMRILKIREFHAEAAEAGIDLALKVSGTQSRIQVHEMVIAHEQRMLLLQERKEVERKALVEAERQKRKKAIRERSSQHIAPSRSNLFGESDIVDLVQQSQKDTKSGRKKKPTSSKADDSAFSQDTVKRKVSSPADKDSSDDWNPFDYDIKTLLASVPGSMAPPIGSSFPSLAADDATASGKQASRPPPASRTASSTSRVGTHEFWVPPTAAESKQPAAPSQKAKTTSMKSRLEPPNPSPNPIAAPQDSKPTATRSSASFAQQGDPIDLQTQGASSSKTTLDDTRPVDPRAFWTPPTMTRSSSNTSTQPSRHEIWIPPAPSQVTASRARATSSATRRPAELSVPSSKIQKSQSMTQDPPETVSDTKRSRRNSDPVSPSPRSFLFPGTEDGVSATGILKKGKVGKSGAVQGGKGKRVTIEDVSDDEEEDCFEHLPSDSKYIMEPKPVVPPAMFEQILDYDEDSSFAPSIVKTPTNANWDKVMEDKAVRAKHVRWTPSVVGGSPVSTVVPDEVVDKPKWTNSREKVVMDKKGKGRMTESGDDLSRFAMEALVGLKKMGGKGL